MSWDDSDFGNEFIKFKKSTVMDDIEVLLGNYGSEIIYIKIFWDDIIDYKNIWNKNRKKVRVNEIRLCQGTPFESDEVIQNSNLYLDMGSRLFNEIRTHSEKKPDFLKIIKYVNPMDRFDTWYRVFEYKLKKQMKVSTTKSKAK